MKAVELFRHGTPEANEQAKQIFRDVIDRDGSNAAIVAGLGWAYMNEFRFGWSQNPQESFVKAVSLAEQSLAMDDTVAVSHALLGFTLLLSGQHDESLSELERSIALEPNSSLFFAIYANALIYAGEPDQALVNVRTAMRLSPFYPAWYLSILALANHDSGRFAESLAATREHIERQQPGLQHLAYMMLVMAHSGLGQQAEAQKAAQEVLRIKPGFSLAELPRIYPYREQATIERMQQTLRDAGLGGAAAD